MSLATTKTKIIKRFTPDDSHIFQMCSLRLCTPHWPWRSLHTDTSVSLQSWSHYKWQIVYSWNIFCDISLNIHQIKNTSHKSCASQRALFQIFYTMSLCWDNWWSSIWASCNVQDRKEPKLNFRTAFNLELQYQI